MGFSVIIYDQKPDYQHIDQPNNDVQKILNENGHTEQNINWVRGIDANFYYLGEDSTTFKGTEIAIPASEFDPSVLAAVMYYPPNENNQREEFETLLEEFDDEQQAAHNDDGSAIWTFFKNSQSIT